MSAAPENARAIEARLNGFIAAELLDGLGDGRDPLQSGAVDSLGIEQLAEYIVEEFDVRLRDEEMVAENFESVAVLAALVEAKRSGATK
jgi:hypothetical protein